MFLEDLDKYRDFVGRGYYSQSGHRMSINVKETYMFAYMKKSLMEMFLKLAFKSLSE